MLYSDCICVLTSISNHADNTCENLLKLPLSTTYLLLEIQILEQYMGLTDFESRGHLSSRKGYVKLNFIFSSLCRNVENSTRANLLIHSKHKENALYMGEKIPSWELPVLYWGWYSLREQWDGNNLANFLFHWDFPVWHNWPRRSTR